MPLHRSRAWATNRLPALTAACLLALLAAGCGSPEPTPDLAAQATIGALATSNAQLTTQVAELAAAAAAGTSAPAEAQPAAQAAPAEAAPADAALPPAAESPIPTAAPAAETPASVDPAAASPVTNESPAPAAAPAAPGDGPLPQLLAGGGYFIDPQRPDQLHEALAALLDDEAQRRRLGEIALQRAGALTWERSARQFRALLDKLEAA